MAKEQAFKQSQDLFGGGVIPLRREPVSSAIVELIIRFLLHKKLKPGDRLPSEAEFVEMLGVGRSSVREAIKMLTSLGVIEVRRGVGTFIPAAISESTVNPLILSLVLEQGTTEELAEFRFSFEQGLIDLVAARVTPEDVAQLKAINQEFREAGGRDPRNVDRLRELNLAFHTRIMAITRNNFLVKMGSVVHTLYSVSSEKVLGLDPDRVYRHHETIIDLIEKRDAAGLKDFIGGLIRQTVNRIKALEGG